MELMKPNSILRNGLRATLLLLVVWHLPGPALAGAPDGELTLWYRQAARNWNEALPVGNGRLGAMIFGGATSERLQLNEDSLWSGAPEDADNPEALVALPEIRQLLFAGRYAEAQRIANQKLICKGAGSGHGRGARVPFGTYQTLGDLRLEFEGDTHAVASYHRELDLATATARVSYALGGVKFAREIFSSFPDQVVVIRLTASQRGALSLRASLSRPEAVGLSAVGTDELLMAGQLWNGQAETGMRYAARLKAICEGGQVTAHSGALRVTGANAVTLLLVAATDYQMQLPDWRQGDPETKTAGQLAAAAKRSFQKLRAAHVADHQRLFHRVSLDLGGWDAAQRPTDERLMSLAKGGTDPALIALYYQFGRYLLISSSRSGDMPANLQGLWADGINTPWNCDYHANINLQMIYWPVEMANLTECFEPLDRYIAFLTGPGAKTAQVHYGARGWTVHTIANAWGFTSPGESPSWGLSPSAGAWLSQHLWEHFAFSRDTNYLRRVLPILRASAEFSLDWLVEDPKTQKLVAGPATSPENTFITADGQRASLCMGPSMEQEIIWDAFNNYLEAARILGVSEPTVGEVERAWARLQLPQIGRDGRLMEWSEEFQEAEPGHRHTSHLFALHPGRQITLTGTPSLAAAARKSLEQRLASGGGHTGWSRAWIINFWARLGAGDQAGENVQALLAKSTLPNLFDTHPPFQIDGNFGGVAGICEMLVQSHTGEIVLLPALPKSWATGSVKGLRARGGYELDLSWRDGKLAATTVRNVSGNGACKVRLGGKTVALAVPKGKARRLDANLQTN